MADYPITIPPLTSHTPSRLPHPRHSPLAVSLFPSVPSSPAHHYDHHHNHSSAKSSDSVTANTVTVRLCLSFSRTLSFPSRLTGWRCGKKGRSISTRSWVGGGGVGHGQSLLPKRGGCCPSTAAASTAHHPWWCNQPDASGWPSREGDREALACSREISCSRYLKAV